MIVREYEIPIPARPNAPATTLYVKVVLSDDASAKTKPHALVLPGGPGFNHSFYQDYMSLSSNANIIFHDPRGCGRSRQWSENNDPKTFNMENYIDDIEVIRQFLAIPKITLIGKSYGAMCALGFVLKFPTVVSNLILAAGSPSYRNIDTAKNLLEQRGTADQKAIGTKLWDALFTSDEEVMQYVAVMASLYSWKKRNGEETHRPAPLYPAAYKPLNQGFGGFLRTFDYSSRLAEIRCPTLILVGKEDWITAEEHSKFMHSQIKGSKLVVFNKADHAMEADVPTLFFNHITKFIVEKQKDLNLPFFIKREEEFTSGESAVDFTYFT